MSCFFSRFSFVFWAGLALAAALPAAAQTPAVMLLVKSDRYMQRSAAVLSPDGVRMGFVVEFSTPPAAGLTVQLRPPSGPAVPLTRDADGTFGVDRAFATAGELESAFPDGLYTLTTAGGGTPTTLTFLVSTGATAAPVTVTNFDALQVLTEPAVTVNWQTIRGARADDFLSLSIERPDESEVFSTPDSFRGDATSVFVPNLPVDVPLTGHLEYARVTATVLNGGATQLGAGRGFGVEFSLRRTPPPVVPPRITSQPVAVAVGGGGSVRLSVIASGTGPFTYQWQKNGASIAGAVERELVIASAQASDAGLYTVVVTGPTGRTVSEPAQVAVGPSVRFSLFAGVLGQPGSADGPLATARFSGVAGLVFDAAGNAYVSDGGNQCIRRISAEGVVSTFAGLPGGQGFVDGSGTTARFGGTGALALDAAGNLYVADGGNFAVRKISPAGVVSTLAGGTEGTADGTGRAARFRSISGLAVDPAGNVYVADIYGCTIRKITPAGVVTTLAGVAGQADTVDGRGAAARLAFPTGLTIDARGVLWVAESESGAIRQVTTAGEVTTFFIAADRQSYRFKGIVVDRDGYVYVTNTSGVTGTVMRFAPNGALNGGDWPRYADFTANPYGLSWFYPVALAFDGRGGLYVPDTLNGAILKVVYPIGSGESGIRIATAPKSHVIVPGGSAVLTVAATGPMVSYQWRRNGVPIPGATTVRLQVPAVTAATAGDYTVLLSNAAGSLVSTVATLSLGTGGEGGRLTNLSIRAQAGTDAQMLVVGLAVAGGAGGTKPVLLRAIGPGLTEFGVTGALADPVLSVYRGSQPVTTNDNWDGSASLAGTFARVGAFPLRSGSLDAAVTNDFGAAAYSVQVTGKTGASGIVLAEIYDATAAGASSGACGSMRAVK
ncbi:MAG: immunoglobulin domain-containing protein [Verrucomicrobia bacterium]|nr:immunoglobulin domain-containing protein [Verrucomicrobiota bacterium]